MKRQPRWSHVLPKSNVLLQTNVLTNAPTTQKIIQLNDNQIYDLIIIITTVDDAYESGYDLNEYVVNQKKKWQKNFMKLGNYKFNYCVSGLAR